MPYYTYHCRDCSRPFELKREVDRRDDPTECPNCSGANNSRLFSLPVLYNRSPSGELKTVGGGSSCGSCVATSCSGCSSGNC